VIPGLIGQELPKDAADLIDWMEFEPTKVAAEGIDSFLSTKLDLMTAVPLAVSLHGGSRRLVDTLLVRLAELADSPLAVRVAGDAKCFVNPRMADDLSRLGPEIETRVAAPVGYAGRASLPAVVRALAAGGLALHTTRLIDNAIVRCVCAGFVAVRDRALGALTGLAELEVALDLAGQSRLRVRAVARERANQGRLRPGYGDEMFRVEAASIEFPSKLPLAALQAEVVSLEAQEWSVEFCVRNSAVWPTPSVSGPRFQVRCANHESDEPFFSPGLIVSVDAGGYRADSALRCGAVEGVPPQEPRAGNQARSR
jgi:hypothetical protein